METSNKTLAVISIVTWLFLILYTVLDSSGIFGSDIGLIPTLQTSNFARVMFMDIGVLSTLVSAFILFKTNLKIRYIFAILTLFIGSFAALPYLAYYFWGKKD